MLHSGVIARKSSASSHVEELLPSRRPVFERIVKLVKAAPVVVMNGLPGMSKTIIARAVARDLGARYIDAAEILEAIRPFNRFRWPEVVMDMVTQGFEREGTVVIDDYPEFTSIYDYERGVVFGDIIMPMLRQLAAQNRRHLLLMGQHRQLWTDTGTMFGSQSLIVDVPTFTVDDYRTYFEWELGSEEIKAIDFDAVFGCAPVLDGYQLELTCNLLRLSGGPIDTDTTVSIMEKHVLHTNLRMNEVEELSFDSLPGTSHIAEALETHIVLPFERRELAQELNVRPRRGVLLYGPPGTGKTSIGRALAHRIKGRFFLLDGRFPTEPPSHFFAAVQNIVAQAKKNAPSILFIDDADVLFEIEHIAGLSRYLLSLLDGLESQTANNVCVMMTAMDPKRVPEALLRSGRVELWLETRLPDEATRSQILERWMDADLPDHDKLDYKRLGQASGGFTPADLRRLAGDAKLLYAADVVAGRPLASAQDYMERAIAELVDLRGTMATHLADETLRIGLSKGMN